MKRIADKLILIMVTVILIMGLVGGSVAGSSQPYQSYIFDQWGQPIPTPSPYTPVQVIDGQTLGVGRFNNPQDIFISSDGNLWLADSRNNRIIQFDRNFAVLRIITGFDADGVTESLNNPCGIFVDDEGVIFIADTDNHRIVRLDADGGLQQIIKYVKPEGMEIDIVEFLPVKIVVDPVGRIFAVVRNVFDGLMEFNEDGEFMGFMGAPNVDPSLTDLFWHFFATKEQRARRALFLPIEYTNLALDRSGFIYAVAKDEARRLNPTGFDVLSEEGLWPVIGDVNLPIDTDPSFLTDITVSNHGIYHVLDSVRGRVFTYDDRGNLLYVFGTIGPYAGAFNRPRAIDNLGEHLYILDETRGQITIFVPTEYAQRIHIANRHYMLGNFQEANDAWHDVLKYNSLYPLAYNGLGMAAMRQRDYQQAMHNFELGNNRDYYSKAFAYHRKGVIEENFHWIMLGVIIIAIIIIFVYKKRSHLNETRIIYDSNEYHGWRRLVYGLRYALHVVVSPADGFWDLRYEGRGNLLAAMIILLLASFSLVFLKQYTGYLFNPRDISRINIFGELGTTIATFLMWCAINWALTTLMEGKGTFTDIVIATAYALTPLILINFPITIISNYLILEEGSYYYFFYYLGMVWAGMLVFSATMVTHHYTPAKTVGTCILNVVGMGIVVFLGLLFLNMTSMLTEYFTTVYREVVFRL